MKLVSFLLVAVCYILFLDGAYSQAVKLNVAEDSKMSITGTSTLHDWTSEVQTIQGYVEVEESFLKKGKAKKGDEIAGVHVVVPVKSIISPRGATMDKKTYNALKSEEHPEIIFDLKDNKIQADGDGYSINAKGDLTIAGQTKQVEFPVKAKLISAEKMSFEGSYKLNMVEYNMEPPSAMFGQIITGEEVEIKFELIVNK